MWLAKSLLNMATPGGVWQTWLADQSLVAALSAEMSALQSQEQVDFYVADTNLEHFSEAKPKGPEPLIRRFHVSWVTYDFETGKFESVVLITSGQVIDFAAGFVNGVLGGIPERVGRWMDLQSDFVDTHSTAFMAGNITGMVVITAISFWAGGSCAAPLWLTRAVAALDIASGITGAVGIVDAARRYSNGQEVDMMQLSFDVLSIIPLATFAASSLNRACFEGSVTVIVGPPLVQSPAVATSTTLLEQFDDIVSLADLALGCGIVLAGAAFVGLRVESLRRRNRRRRQSELAAVFSGDLDVLPEQPLSWLTNEESEMTHEEYGNLFAECTDWRESSTEPREPTDAPNRGLALATIPPTSPATVHTRKDSTILSPDRASRRSNARAEDRDARTKSHRFAGWGNSYFWPAVLSLLALLCMGFGLNYVRAGKHSNSSSALAASDIVSAPYQSKTIRDVRLADWILAEGPETPLRQVAEANEFYATFDPDEWRTATLRMVKDDGSNLARIIHGQCVAG